MSMNEATKTLLERLLNKDEFSESELKALCYQCDDCPNIYAADYKTVNEIRGDDHRWDAEMKNIIEIGGHLFCIEWRRGLTESQEDYFDYQPYEVIRNEYQKTITVVEYNRVRGNER